MWKRSTTFIAHSDVRHALRAVMVVAATSGACHAQGVIVTPWNESRLDAMVRVEVDGSTPKPTIGSGFLVAGLENQLFVITSRHVLTGSAAPHEASRKCEPLPSQVNITMFRRDRDVEKLTHEGCYWSLKSDIALVPISRRRDGYKVLKLAAREFQRFDWVYPAGYPNGYGLDATRIGNVSSLTDHSPDELVVASADTFEGVSGGPYLSSAGTVVGVHVGGIRAVARYSHFMSIKRARDELVAFVGEIPTDKAPPPDLRTIADELARRADVGSMLALQALPDPKQRIDVWSSFKGTPVTAQEERFLRALPTTPLMEDQSHLTSNVLEAARDNRTELGLRLRALEAANQQLCLATQMRFEDGRLFCNNQPRSVPASYPNVAITPSAIVIHNSVSTNLGQTLDYLGKAGGQAPVHFVVDRDGSIIQLVPVNRKAFAAAPENPVNSRAAARNAVGIVFMNAGELRKVGTAYVAADGAPIPVAEVEIVTQPSETFWQRFSGSQLAAGEELVRALVRNHEIQSIVGMCQLGFGSERNPGPAFPLDKLSRDILGKQTERCRIPSPPMNLTVE